MQLQFLIFIPFIVVFFVLGIACLIKVYFDSADVDKTQLKTLEQELEEKKETAHKLGVDLTNVRKELEESKAGLQKAKELEDEIATLQDKEGRYKDEIRVLQMDVREISRKTDQQAKDALEVIETLQKERDETEGSKEESEEIKQKIDLLSSDNAQLKQDLDDKLKALEALKNNLSEIQTKEEERAKEALAVIEQLKDENETLKSIESESDEATGQIDKLTGEIETLQQQLEEERERVRELAATAQEAASSPEAVPAPEAADTSELVEQRTENQTVPQTGSSLKTDEEFKELYADFKTQLEKMRETVNDLKSEGAAGSQGSAEEQAQLEENLEKLQEINSFLVEKEKILQNELKKSRVEAMGLKQICEDFKVQLEQKS